MKYRASSLYIDPLLVELKLRLASSEELAPIFLKSWHPIASLDQLTPVRLKEGLDYWNRLLTLEERFRTEKPPENVQLEALDVKDLIKMRAISPEEFSECLQALRQELAVFEQKKAGFRHGEGVDYWDFIYRDEFSETVLRAYLTSFLLTEGHASLLIDPLEDEVRITSIGTRTSPAEGRPSRSIALSLSYEFWRGLQEVKRVE